MDYIYSQLNNTVELLENQFKTTILETDQISPTETDKGVELNINYENLVRLLPISLDTDPNNDAIQQFQLFGYNIKSKEFDLPIGDPIKINHNNVNATLKELKFKDANGNIIDVGCSVDETGATVIEYIPIAAISDTHITNNGEVVYVESIIDGNG